LSGVLALTGTTDNGVITYISSSNSGQVEANFTFNGTSLSLTGSLTSSGDITAPYISASSGIYDNSGAAAIQFVYISSSKLLTYITPLTDGDILQYSGSVMTGSNLIDGGTF
jgi:hypothetical protein